MEPAENHLRCQVEYEKGFENYIEALIEDIKPVLQLDCIGEYYFFWQDYSKKFERHIQLDLLVNENYSRDEAKYQTNAKLDETGRNYYWEEDFTTTWYGLTEKEKEILLQSRINNAAIALQTLEAHINGELEHQPPELVNRNYHLTANQHGMTHLDELRFCTKRIIQLISMRLLGDRLYNRLFLSRELEKF